MKNTFRFALTAEDYISFYRTQIKRTMIIPAFIAMSFVAAMAAYYCIVLKNKLFLLCIAVAIILTALYTIYYYTSGIKRMVNKMTSADTSYFRETELTVDEGAIETNNLPRQGEAGIIAVYPYAVMNVIYETQDLITFVVGNEAKLLPKRAIPQQMQDSVYKQIKKSPKYMDLSRKA